MCNKLPVLPSTPLPTPDRRVFLLVSGVAVAVAACTITDPRGDAAADASTSDNASPEPNDATTMPPDSIAPNDVPTACMTRPSDVVEGGALLLPNAARHGIFLARDAGGIFALSGICQHQGCGVEFRASARTFECPCHGSLHAYDGSVLVGPTLRGLNHVAVTLENGCLVIDPNTIVPSTTRLNA